ncbi:MAG: hypothetical protein JNK82_20840 [Myxococcaceae bacterium]|nr:hypothetical protein [Myxococcaceae bacterium]
MNPTTNVAQAFQQYLDENGFNVDEYTKPFVTMTLGPLKLTMKNRPARQKAIPLHDLHHVSTGYGTDLAGEAEIGTWELRAGCPNAFLVLINFAAMVLGLFIAPRRVLRAWRDAKGARSLYTQELTFEALGKLTVGELRAHLGVPHDGIANPAERRLFKHRAPSGAM